MVMMRGCVRERDKKKKVMGEDKVAELAREREREILC
jgi:hypothetical protein